MESIIQTSPDYARQTIAIMKRAVYALRMAFIYVQRIDQMLSDDDGEYDLIIVFIIHNSLLVVAKLLFLHL